MIGLASFMAATAIYQTAVFMNTQICSGRPMIVAQYRCANLQKTEDDFNTAWGPFGEGVRGGTFINSSSSIITGAVV